MSERKVLNKYIPPDFDPTRVPRSRKGKSNSVVRLMTPFSMRCISCGEYIYKGKKFNARKETAEGEAYLGIKIYRFYVRCPVCSSEISFKTDPQNNDYTMGSGAKRNFEPWKKEADELKELRKKKMEKEENDPIAMLENISYDSRREMEIFNNLNEIKSANQRIQKIASGNVLKKLGEIHRENDKMNLMVEEKEDEEILDMYFGASALDALEETNKINPFSFQHVFHESSENEVGKYMVKPAQNPYTKHKSVFTEGSLGIVKRR